MAVYELPSPRPRRLPIAAVLLGLFVLLFFARSIAGLFIDYAWWHEIGQVELWYDTWFYAAAPIVAGAVVLFIFFFLVHARGLKSAGGGLSQYPGYARISALVLLVLAGIIAAFTIDAWAVARYVGSVDGGGGYRDPVFNRSLAFHFFTMPFYRLLLNFVSVAAISGGLIYWLSSQAVSLLARLRDLPAGRL